MKLSLDILNSVLRLLVGCLVGCVLAMSSIQAQEPNSKLWNWSPPGPHHDSAVMIRIGFESGESEIGTGVVIHVDKNSPQDDGYLGFIATASHLFRGNGEAGDEARNEIRIYYANGARDIARQCSIVRREQDLDVAILWAWIPKDVSAAELSRRSAERGDSVEFVGLGGKQSLDEGLRHFTAVASAPTDEERIYADPPLLPGDSGGPIFDRRGRLLGIVSGGWFWWSHETMKTKYDQPLRATWPSRGSNIYPLALLIADLPTDENGRCSASKSKRGKYKNKNGVKVATMPVPRRQHPNEIAQLDTASEPVVAGESIAGTPINGIPIEESIVEWVPSIDEEVVYEMGSSTGEFEYQDQFQDQYFDTQYVE